MPFDFRVINTSLLEGPAVVGLNPLEDMMGMYFVFNFLLVSLLVLHTIWSYFICRVVHDIITKGQVGFGPLAQNILPRSAVFQWPAKMPWC